MEFQAFDTWDEMIEAINKAREQADTRVKPGQAAIKTGDYFVQNTEYGFPIFGKVIGSDDNFYKTDEGKNYRFCKCFSVACPEGEFGDVHVSVIACLITKEVFEHFEANNWQIEPI